MRVSIDNQEYQHLQINFTAADIIKEIDNLDMDQYMKVVMNILLTIAEDPVVGESIKNLSSSENNKEIIKDATNVLLECGE